MTSSATADARWRHGRLPYRAGWGLTAAFATVMVFDAGSRFGLFCRSGPWPRDPSLPAPLPIRRPLAPQETER